MSQNKIAFYQELFCTHLMLSCVGCSDFVQLYEACQVQEKIAAAAAAAAAAFVLAPSAVDSIVVVGACCCCWLHSYCLSASTRICSTSDLQTD